MVHPISSILELAPATMSGLKTPDTSGTVLEVERYSTSGLTSTYTRTRAAVYTGSVKEAHWRYTRMGGCG